MEGMERYEIQVGRKKASMRIIPTLYSRNNPIQEPLFIFKSFRKSLTVSEFVNSFKHFFLKRILEIAEEIQVPSTVQMYEGLSGCRDYYIHPLPRYERIRFQNPTFEDFYSDHFHITMSQRIESMEISLRALPIVLFVLIRDYEIDTDEELQDFYVDAYNDFVISDVKPFLTSNEVNLTSGDEIQ